MMILTDKKPRVNVEGILTSEEIHEIEHHMGHYPYPRAASLDALKCVQRRNGWVDDAQLHAIAQLLTITTADLEGVATFYNRTTPGSPSSPPRSDAASSPPPTPVRCCSPRRRSWRD
jgi:hypothetical protein